MMSCSSNISSHITKHLSLASGQCVPSLSGGLCWHPSPVCLTFFWLPFQGQLWGPAFPLLWEFVPTFVSGFVCAFLHLFPLGLSAAVGTAGSSPYSGAGGDVTRASGEQLQGAVSCPHQPRRALQPWGSPVGTRYIVDGQNHLIPSHPSPAWQQQL